MLPRFTVIDVETPNARNDSMCAIGLIHYDNGNVTERYYLVNPEDRFDTFNTYIHGITPNDIVDSLIFPEVWEEIKHFFDCGVVVAHNAPFDMGVLCKCLARYNIEIPPLKYICTVILGRQRHEPSNKLDVLSKKYGVELKQHHNAMCDTKACFGLLKIFDGMKEVTEKDLHSNNYAPNKDKEEMSGQLIFRLTDDAFILCEDGKQLADIVTTTTIDKNCKIPITDKVFCLLGSFEFGSISEIAELITLKGGTCVANITPHVDYAVIGGLTTEQSEKITMALSLQDKGYKIKVIPEKDFLQF